MQAHEHVLSNQFYPFRDTPERLLGEPQCWAKLDYQAIQDPNAEATLNWDASRGWNRSWFVPLV